MGHKFSLTLLIGLHCARLRRRFAGVHALRVVPATRTLLSNSKLVATYFLTPPISFPFASEKPVESTSSCSPCLYQLLRRAQFRGQFCSTVSTSSGMVFDIIYLYTYFLYWYL